MPNANTTELRSVIDYLDWANRNNRTLQFNLTDSDIRNIQSVQDSKGYYKFLADNRLEDIPNFELFNQFNEYIKVVRDGASWQDLPYFAKYFNNSTTKTQVDYFPKFMQLSGHAETLAPIFSGFGELLITRPAPGSGIFIEFFEFNKKLYVKSFYKETAEAEPKVFKIDSYVKVNDFYDGGVGIDDF